MRDRIDPNDLAYALARARSRIVHAQPSPFGGNGGINPHVTRFWLLDGRIMDLFHVKPVYYEAKDGSWRPLSEIAAHHGNKRITLYPKAMEVCSWRYLAWLMKRQRLLGSELRFGYPGSVYAGVQPHDLVRALTLTAFPDPSPETTTVDGRVHISPGAGPSWDTNHDAADGSAIDDSGATWYAGAQESTGVSNYLINRGFHLYDTSALTPGATISAVTCSLNGGGAPLNTNNDGDDWVNITASSPASNTALVIGDFDQCGAVNNPTEFCDTRIDIGSWSSAYNDFVLNAAGLAAISKTAVTKLGLREGHDAIDSAPANDTGNYVDVQSAETAATTSDPKLVVTYTLPTSSGRAVYLVELYPRQRSATAVTGVGDRPIGILPIGIVAVATSPGGGIVSFFYSDAGYVSPPTGTNASTFFSGRASQPLRLNRMLPVAPEMPRRVAVEVAGIEIENSDGDLDGLIDEYAIDGRRVAVLFGRTDDVYDDFVPVFSGRGVEWKQDLIRLEVTARDEAHLLDVPLQTSLYGGTGGADGTTELKGKPKPICLGQCGNVNPPLIDPTNLVYQFHSRAAQEVTAVYDRGAALSFDSDAANYAALIAVALSAGEYATCLALGLFRLQSVPSGLVTADVRGDAQGSYSANTFTLAQRVLTDFASIDTADIDTAAFTAMAAEVTGTMGWYRGTEAISAEAALSEIVGHCSAWWGGTVTGPFTCGRLEAPDSSDVELSIELGDVIEARIIESPPGTNPPRFRQRVGFNLNWTVQRGEDLAAAVTAARRQYLAEPYSVSTATNAAAQTDFALAQDPEPLVSLFVNAADADVESLRLLDLLSTPRLTVLLELKTGGHDAALGATVALTYPRINSGNTWYARVIGHEVDAKRRRVSVILWG